MTSEHRHSVEKVDAFEHPDFIVGIPSLNEEDTIQFVAEQMARGIEEHYPDSKANVINVDNASTDNTKQNFLEADTGQLGKMYISTPPGKKGKGRNFHNLFHEVVEEEPEAVAVVDSDLTSVETDWAKLMFGTVLDGYDLVTPVYKRHQYDGTITNHLCYPITYGINGQNVRQPIGGDFAFSTESAAHWLQQDWVEATFYYGIDIFMTTTTILRGAPVAGARLGRKDHNPSEPRLKEMFKEVAHSLFFLLNTNRDYWNRDMDVRDMDMVGSNEGYETPSLEVNYEKLTRELTSIFRRERDKIEQFLPEELFLHVENLVENEQMELEAEEWSRVLFSAILNYMQDPDEGTEIMEGLLPLYMLRNASFVNTTGELRPEECDRLIQEQAKTFYENRDMLRNGLAKINADQGTDGDTAAAGA